MSLLKYVEAVAMKTFDRRFCWLSFVKYLVAYTFWMLRFLYHAYIKTCI